MNKLLSRYYSIRADHEDILGELEGGVRRDIEENGIVDSNIKPDVEADISRLGLERGE